jgi:hypothetical protein
MPPIPNLVLNGYHCLGLEHRAFLVLNLILHGARQLRMREILVSLINHSLKIIH